MASSRHYTFAHLFATAIHSLTAVWRSVTASAAAFTLAVAALIAPAAYALPLPAFEPVQHTVVSEQARKASLTEVKASESLRFAGASYRHAAGTATR